MENNIDLLNYAQYSIMVATNSVTDDTRNSYFATINGDRIKGADAFNALLVSVFKGIDDKLLDSEVAKKLVETEYNKSCLHEIFGDYNPFSALINSVIDIKVSAETAHNFDIGEFKYYINIADTLDKDFAITIYYIMLTKMCFTHKILEDIEFSRKLINYVNDYPTFNRRFLCDVLSTIFL